MKLENRDIVIAPLVSEKSTDQKEKFRTLCFKVHRQANKIQVKKAVEALFETQVESVRVINYDGKIKRYGKYSGRRASWKKAFVTLKADAKMIEYVEVV